MAANGLLFVSSNVGVDVAAYDLANGVEKWCFISEGPVRFAPVASNNRVWFASEWAKLAGFSGYIAAREPSF